MTRNLFFFSFFASFVFLPLFLIHHTLHTLTNDVFETHMRSKNNKFVTLYNFHRIVTQRLPLKTLRGVSMLPAVFMGWK